ncbi:hypothetical protein ACYULU_14240 [Breznakiellaceae bacterium SP9]
MAGDNPAVGLDFIASDGTVTRIVMTNVSVNSLDTRSFIVPPLAAGDYTLNLTFDRDIKKNLTTKYTKNTKKERKKFLPFVLFVPFVVDFSSFLFYGSRLGTIRCGLYRNIAVRLFKENPGHHCIMTPLCALLNPVIARS